MDGVRLRQEIRTNIDTLDLFDLISQPEILVSLEPRLKSARWIKDDAPKVGAQAEVVTDLKFKVPVVRRLVPSPHGIVTVTEWDPPRRCAGHFVSDDLDIRIGVSVFDGSRNSEHLEVDGLLRFRSRILRSLLRPLYGLFEDLCARSIQRGMTRLEANLDEESLSKLR